MDQNQAFNQPNYFQPLLHGGSQPHPHLVQSPQEYGLNNNRQNSEFFRRPVQGDLGSTLWTQNEFIARVLEIETSKHNETRSELNVYRTQCFKQEQILASERAQNISLHNIIHQLRAECHESKMGKLEAESRIQELQSAGAYAHTTEEGNFTVGMGLSDANLQLDSPLSSYRSATFSPSLPSLEELRRGKRKSPPDSRNSTKRIRFTAPTLNLSSPLTPTAMTMDSTG